MMAAVLTSLSAGAREFHVSVTGDDGGDGSPASMLKTISAGAERAQPGDVITVHEGVYRERINPPRGGTSDKERIVYQAAPGEKVVVKGSERIKGWEKVDGDTWMVNIPNAAFGDFNPYKDRIHGDWFNGKGRVHHTGAVYLDGHWLTEAARLVDIMKPAGKDPLWFTMDARPTGGYLFNVAWLRPGTQGQVPAVQSAARQGTMAALSEEGGQCLGFIKAGNWVRYEGVDFGAGTQRVELRVASESAGGVIELRLGSASGELLGTGVVPITGGWQSWKSVTADIKPTRGSHTLCLVFRAHGADVDTTTIWAQFPGVDPNEENVEINTRQSVFYPEKPRMNYITVRGFTMMHAATPWSPPTAEQIGLIGTHWSKGWIIENNIISYSRCVGVTLGKYGDEWDNRSDTADAYTKTVRRALKNGWAKENIGSHIVRNNHISHCEQAGIVGSLGAIFSKIIGNEIHDIHVLKVFKGFEMAGIKLHGPIDVLIADNHIHHTVGALWLDWMTQGTRVTRNLLHDNGTDLGLEANHGPFLIDNNLFLSAHNMGVISDGGCFAP